MNANDHYGLDVKHLTLRIECGDHAFVRDGTQEGPCVCPECGREFTLTWNVTIDPKLKDGELPF